jgi:hypothetical protein
VRATFGGEIVREVCEWSLANPEAARAFSASLSDRTIGALGALSDLLKNYPAAAKSFLRDCDQSHRLLLASLVTAPVRRRR